MSKKKNSMALFEVISKTRDKNPDAEVIVPSWVKGDQQEQQAPSATDETPTQDQDAAPQTEPPAPPPTEPKLIETKPIEIKPVEPETAGPEPIESEPITQTPELQEVDAPETPSEPSVATTSTWEPRHTESKESSDQPIWSTDGARLTLSLNYISCMAACLGLLVLLIAAFALGRLTASPEAPTVTPKQTVIKRELGKFYMVIQALPGRDATSMAEAKRIAEFCTANGEPAQVQLIPGRTRGTGHLIVWSAKPFDAQQGVEVRAHALSLQNELGPKYAKRYGSQYKFTQPQRNGTLIPKMYQYTKRR